MAEFADYALDDLDDEDAEQLRTLGHSNVFRPDCGPLSDEEQARMEGELPKNETPAT